MPVVGLKSLKLNSQRGVDVAQRAHKKRVFTEDEYNFLQTLSIGELKNRQNLGRNLIAILYNPAAMNMTPKQAAAVSSNLKFQIDAIQNIINAKELSNG